MKTNCKMERLLSFVDHLSYMLVQIKRKLSLIRPKTIEDAQAYCQVSQDQMLGSGKEPRKEEEPDIR